MKKSVIVYIDIRLLIIKITLFAVIIIISVTWWKWNRFTSMEFSSADLDSSFEVTDLSQIRLFTRELRKSEYLEGGTPGLPVYNVKLKSKRQVKMFVFETPKFIWDKKRGRLIKPSGNLRRILEDAVTELKKRSPYGDKILWEDAKVLFPPGARAKVTDIDTGQQFLVQRTGGYNHAEVEPLTSGDTARMKKIYQGKWSWKRKAVVVQTGGGKFAASMIGMPRGPDIIQGNNFWGQFPLYFPGKAVNDGPDLSHLLMIWKAAGKTRHMLRGMNPEGTLLVLFTAIDQGDSKTLKIIFPYKIGLKKIKDSGIIGVTVYNIKEIDKFNYDAIVSVSFKKGPYNIRKRVILNVKQNKTWGIYQVGPDFVDTLLAR